VDLLIGEADLLTVHGDQQLSLAGSARQLAVLVTQAQDAEAHGLPVPAQAFAGFLLFRGIWRLPAGVVGCGRLLGVTGHELGELHDQEEVLVAQLVRDGGVTHVHVCAFPASVGDVDTGAAEVDDLRRRGDDLLSVGVHVARPVVPAHAFAGRVEVKGFRNAVDFVVDDRVDRGRAEERLEWFLAHLQAHELQQQIGIRADLSVEQVSCVVGHGAKGGKPIGERRAVRLKNVL
jgi:hypothetical protein